jgi:hypothetical protein
MRARFEKYVRKGGHTTASLWSVAFCVLIERTIAAKTENDPIQ